MLVYATSKNVSLWIRNCTWIIARGSRRMKRAPNVQSLYQMAALFSVKWLLKHHFKSITGYGTKHSTPSIDVYLLEENNPAKFYPDPIW